MCDGGGQAYKERALRPETCARPRVLCICVNMNTAVELSYHRAGVDVKRRLYGVEGPLGWLIVLAVVRLGL